MLIVGAIFTIVLILEFLYILSCCDLVFTTNPPIHQKMSRRSRSRKTKKNKRFQKKSKKEIIKIARTLSLKQNQSPMYSMDKTGWEKSSSSGGGGGSRNITTSTNTFDDGTGQYLNFLMQNDSSPTPDEIEQQQFGFLSPDGSFLERPSTSPPPINRNQSNSKTQPVYNPDDNVFYSNQYNNPQGFPQQSKIPAQQQSQQQQSLPSQDQPEGYYVNSPCQQYQPQPQ